MRITLAMAVACLSMGLSLADEAHAAIKKDTTIPAQGLGSALKQLANERDIQLVYRSDVVGQRQTSGAVGELTVDEALTRLLKGTGLTYQYIDDQAITIVPMQSTSGAPTSTSSSGGVWERFRLAQAEQPASTSSSRADNEIPDRRLTLEEVIVTAQKREELLIETPISISVLSGEELERGNSRSLTETLNQVAGVSVTESAPGQNIISVRGVVAGVGSTSTTAYYMDEVPFGYIRFSGLLDTDAYDLQRVEVLRGPQGTLYGSSALGGVIRVLSSDADVNDYEAKIRLRASSIEDGGENYEGHAAVNVPLIPGKLAIRGVASHSELGGYVESTFDGRDEINHAETENYRFKVNYQPTDDLSLKLGYWRSTVNNGARTVASEDYTYPWTSEQPGERVLDMYSLVGEYTWPSMSLLSSTGYIDYTAANEDVIVPPNFTNKNIEAHRAFSQEFRLSSRTDSAWQWLVGAFYRDATERSRNDARPILPFVGEQVETSESYAVFGDVTRSLADNRFDVTVGLRYFEDRVDSSDKADFFGRPPFPDESAKFDRTTGRLVLNYKPREGSTLYGSVATGFRSGQHQLPAVRRDATLPPADPDSLITYELGAKGSLHDATLTFETAVYYMDWKDIQQNLLIPFLGTNLLGRTNAGRASGPGVDAAVSYQPIRALSLHASIGWNGLEFSEDVLSRGVVLFESGDRLNDSPEWTGSIGANLRTPAFAAGVDFVSSANFAYGSTRYNRALGGSGVIVTESDDLAELGVTAGLESDRWSLMIYGDNILNDDATLGPRSPNPNLVNFGIRQRPRTVGLQVTFNY